MLKEILARIMDVLIIAVAFIVALIVATFLPEWVSWTVVGLWVLAYVSKPFIKWLVGREN